MDGFDSPFNTLSFDEQVLSDKLGLTYDRELRDTLKKKEDNAKKAMPSMDERIREHLEPVNIKKHKKVDYDSDDESDRIIRKLRKQGLIISEPRETFVGSRNGFCGGSGDSGDNILDNRMLIFLIIIVAVFCFVQYMNNQQMVQSVKEIMMMNTSRPVTPMPAV